MAMSNLFSMTIQDNLKTYSEKANGNVEIPFNTQYFLKFTNNNNRNAVVKISIDGKNVSDNGYLIPTLSSIVIKRHASIDKGFKFVDLRSKEACKCNKCLDNTNKLYGLIEAQFYLEKQCHYINTSWPLIYNCCSFNTTNYAKHLSDGCTVDGKSTGQIFGTTDINIEDHYTSIKLFLQGYREEELKIQIGNVCLDKDANKIGIVASIQNGVYRGITFDGQTWNTVRPQFISENPDTYLKNINI